MHFPVSELNLYIKPPFSGSHTIHLIQLRKNRHIFFGVLSYFFERADIKPIFEDECGLPDLMNDSFHWHSVFVFPSLRCISLFRQKNIWISFSENQLSNVFTIGMWDILSLYPLPTGARWPLYVCLCRYTMHIPTLGLFSYTSLPFEVSICSPALPGKGIHLLLQLHFPKLLCSCCQWGCGISGGDVASFIIPFSQKHTFV